MKQPSEIESVVRAAVAAALAERDQLKPREVGGIKDMPLREVWGEYVRLKLSIPAGQRGAVRSGKTVYSAEPTILGDPILLTDEGGNVVLVDGKPVITWPGVTFEWEGRQVRLGDMMALSITPEMAERWLQALVTAPRRDEKEGPLSVHHRNRMLTILQGVLSWKYGKGRHNLVGAKKEKIPKDARRTGHLTEAQLEEFCQYAEPDLADMVRVGTDFGCLRRGEVVMLRIEWVNWETGWVSLPEYAVKNGEARKFPLSDANMAILRRRREMAKRGNPYLFQDIKQAKGPCKCQVAQWRYPHEEGHIKLNRYSRMVDRASAKSGILIGTGEKKRPPTPHDFRRTGATNNLIKLEGNLPALMAFGGWNTAKIALEYRQEDAAELEAFKQMTNRSAADVLAARAQLQQPPAPKLEERKPPRPAFRKPKPKAAARARRPRR